MTGITHQLIAILAALWILTLFPVSLGVTLGILSIIAVILGALTPDIDQPTANIWQKTLGGKAFERLFRVFSGGHRHLTHSILGIIAIALLTRWLLKTFIAPEYVEQSLVLWRAYMIGYISHPIADTFTDRGVPWFWPIRLHIRIPPGHKHLRVTTGSFVEMLLLRLAIIITIALILSTHWPVLVNLFK